MDWAATESTGLIRQTQSVGAGRLSWAGGSTAWTRPDLQGLPGQAAQLRRAGVAAIELRFALAASYKGMAYGLSPHRSLTASWRVTRKGRV